MSEVELSIPALLERRVQQQPDDIAYTFVDYEIDPAGVAESLTWSQIYRRAQVVAGKLSKLGGPGDRAVILAPQGLDYLIGFMGALVAGFIAVPLSVPQFGRHDERVVGALGDCTPVAALTTSPFTDDVREFLQEHAGQRPPRVIEVDTLDFEPGPAAPTEPVRRDPVTKTAYLQYTSGSTGRPAGVAMSHRNVVTNIDQAIPDLYEAHGGAPVAGTTVVSWAPFYHDMGMVMGVFIPLVYGCPAVLMSPVAFMQKPARWMQQLAANSNAFTAAPNFAFDLAAARTSDDDLAGLDLSGVKVMINGAERVQAATLRRFVDKFSRYGLPESALRQVYGMAEATVYVVCSPGGQAPNTGRFDPERLSAGHAERCEQGGTELVGCGTPRSSEVRVVDPETSLEKPAGEVGEIWAYGDHVAAGYWRNPELTARTFGGQLAAPSEGTPKGPWLKTGDYGAIVDGELYMTGRMKDLLIVDGRNIYPDDIETTISGVTGGRVAAVSIPDDSGERLVVVAELKKGDTAQFHTVKSQVTAAVSVAHGVRVADLVLVGPRSLPVTTSGKIRRSASADLYRRGEFSRLDAD